jgi:hypothetical protein
MKISEEIFIVFVSTLGILYLILMIGKCICS